MESLYIPAEISHLPDMSQQGRWMEPGIFDRADKGSVRNIPEPSSLTISLEFNYYVQANLKVKYKLLRIIIII